MPDLILFNANVISLDPGIKNARTVAVRDGTIVAVTSYGLNGNCAGLGAGYRIDKQADLDFIYSFLP